MYCYFIVLVGNYIFLVVLCVDYINLLYITLETLYVYEGVSKCKYHFDNLTV